MNIADSQDRLKFLDDGVRILNFGNKPLQPPELASQKAPTVAFPEKQLTLDAPNAILSGEMIQHTAIDDEGRLAVALDQDLYVRDGKIQKIPLGIPSNTNWFITHVAWSPQQTITVITSAGCFLLYSLKTHRAQVFHQFTSAIKCLLWDKKSLYVGLSNRNICKFGGSDEHPHTKYIGYEILALARSTNKLAVGCNNMAVICTDKWDMLHLEHRGPVCAVDWHPTKHNILATACGDRISIWNINTGKYQTVLGRSIINNLYWNPMGTAIRSVLGEVNNPLEVWVFSNGRLVGKHDAPGIVKVASSSISPNRRYMSTMNMDETVHIWILPDPMRETKKTKKISALDAIIR